MFIGLAASAVALLLTAGSLVPAAGDGGARQEDAGVMSANVEHIATVPGEQGTATGAQIIGDILYMTSWRSLSIYDVSDPLEPVLLSRTPLGFQFQNENVSTNGEILLFAEQAPVDRLHVWDVSDPTAPSEIGTLLTGGTHTATCIQDCRWSYGTYDFVGPQGPSTGGLLVDLADPENPVEVGHYNENLPATQIHDVTEIRPGIVLSASRPIQLLDAREDPLNPKLLAVGTNDDKRMHTAHWPRRGKDKFILTTFETNGNPRCTEQSGEFTTWDARKWRRTGTFEPIDEYRVASGTYFDGSPAVNQLGCSAHWFEEHPTFHNGGLVAAGFYEHGVRFLDVAKDGMISEVGYFMGWGGSTSAAYWLTDEIVYAVDYSRGIDILRFDRDAPTGTTEDVDTSMWNLLGSAVTGSRLDGFACRLGT